MSRKHYIKFAEFIRNYGSQCEESARQTNQFVKEDMARMVCEIAKQDNWRFDTGRFRKACGFEMK